MQLSAGYHRVYTLHFILSACSGLGTPALLGATRQVRSQSSTQGDGDNIISDYTVRDYNQRWQYTQIMGSVSIVMLLVTESAKSFIVK